MASKSENDSSASERIVVFTQKVVEWEGFKSVLDEDPDDSIFDSSEDDHRNDVIKGADDEVEDNNYKGEDEDNVVEWEGFKSVLDEDPDDSIFDSSDDDHRNDVIKSADDEVEHNKGEDKDNVVEWEGFKSVLDEDPDDSIFDSSEDDRRNDVVEAEDINDGVEENEGEDEGEVDIKDVKDHPSRSVSFNNADEECEISRDDEQSEEEYYPNDIDEINDADRNDNDEESLIEHSSASEYSSSVRKSSQESQPSLQEELVDAEYRQNKYFVDKVSSDEDHSHQSPIYDIEIEQTPMYDIDPDIRFSQRPFSPGDDEYGVRQQPLFADDDMSDEGMSDRSMIIYDIDEFDDGKKTVLPRIYSPEDKYPIPDLERIHTPEFDDTISVDHCDLQDSLNNIIYRTIKNRKNIDPRDVTLFNKDSKLSKIWPGNITNFNFRIGYREHGADPKDNISFPQAEADVSDPEDHHIETRSDSSQRSSGVISITKIFSKAGELPRAKGAPDVIQIVDNLTNALVYMVNVNKELKSSKGRSIISDSSSDKMTSSGSSLRTRTRSQRDSEYLRCLKICKKSYCSGKCGKGQKVGETYPRSRISFTSEGSTASHTNSVLQYKDRIRDLAIRRRENSLQHSHDCDDGIRRTVCRFPHIPARPTSTNIEDQIKDCINISNSLESLLTGGPPILKSSRSLSKSMPNIYHSDRSRLESEGNVINNRDASNPSLSTIESVTQGETQLQTQTEDFTPNTVTSEYTPTGQEPGPSHDIRVYNDDYNPATAKLKEVIRVEKELEDCVKLSISLEELIVDYVERSVQPLSMRSCSLPDVRGDESYHRRNRHVSETIQAGDKWHSDTVMGHRINDRPEYYTESSTDSYDYERPRSRLKKSDLVMNFNLSTGSVTESEDISFNYKRSDFHKLDFAKDKPNSRRYIEPSKVVRFSKLESTESDVTEDLEQQARVGTPSITPEYDEYSEEGGDSPLGGPRHRDAQHRDTQHRNPQHRDTQLRDSQQRDSQRGLTRSVSCHISEDTPSFHMRETLEGSDTYSEESEDETSYTDEDVGDEDDGVIDERNPSNQHREEPVPEHQQNLSNNLQQISRRIQQLADDGYDEVTPDSSLASSDEEDEVAGFDTSYIVDSQDESLRRKSISVRAENGSSADLIIIEASPRLVNSQTSPIIFTLPAAHESDEDDHERLLEESSGIDKITISSSYSQTESSEPLFRPITFTSSYSQTEEAAQVRRVIQKSETYCQTSEFFQTSEYCQTSEPSKRGSKSERVSVHIIRNGSSKSLTKTSEIFTDKRDTNKRRSSDKSSDRTEDTDISQQLSSEKSGRGSMQRSYEEKFGKQNKRQTEKEPEGGHRKYLGTQSKGEPSRSKKRENRKYGNSDIGLQPSSENSSRGYTKRSEEKSSRMSEKRDKQQRVAEPERGYRKHLQGTQTKDKPSQNKPREIRKDESSQYRPVDKNASKPMNRSNRSSKASSRRTSTVSTREVRKTCPGLSTTIPTLSDDQNRTLRTIEHRPITFRRHVKGRHHPMCHVKPETNPWRFTSTSSRLLNDPNRCPVMVKISSPTGYSGFPIHMKKKKNNKEIIASNHSLREYKLGQFIPEEIEDCSKSSFSEGSFKVGYDFLNDHQHEIEKIAETKISMRRKETLVSMFKEVGISEKRCLKLIKRLS